MGNRLSVEFIKITPINIEGEGCSYINLIAYDDYGRVTSVDEFTLEEAIEILEEVESDNSQWVKNVTKHFYPDDLADMLEHAKERGGFTFGKTYIDLSEFDMIPFYDKWEQTIRSNTHTIE